MNFERGEIPSDNHSRDAGAGAQARRAVPLSSSSPVRLLCLSLVGGGKGEGIGGLGWASWLSDDEASVRYLPSCVGVPLDFALPLGERSLVPREAAPVTCSACGGGSRTAHEASGREQGCRFNVQTFSNSHKAFQAPTHT